MVEVSACTAACCLLRPQSILTPANISWLVPANVWEPHLLGHSGQLANNSHQTLADPAYSRYVCAVTVTILLVEWYQLPYPKRLDKKDATGSVLSPPTRALRFVVPSMLLVTLLLGLLLGCCCSCLSVTDTAAGCCWGAAAADASSSTACLTTTSRVGLPAAG